MFDRLSLTWAFCLLMYITNSRFMQITHMNQIPGLKYWVLSQEPSELPNGILKVEISGAVGRRRCTTQQLLMATIVGIDHQGYQIHDMGLP